MALIRKKTGRDRQFVFGRLKWAARITRRIVRIIGKGTKWSGGTPGPMDEAGPSPFFIVSMRPLAAPLPEPFKSVAGNMEGTHDLAISTLVAHYTHYRGRYCSRRGSCSCSRAPG